MTSDVSATWSPSWRLRRHRVALPTGATAAYADLPPIAGGQGRDAPVLVLLHGLTNDADSWADTAATLRRELPGTRVVIPDLRGHGQSDVPSDGNWRHAPDVEFAMSQLAADVTSLLDTLGVGAATLAGHSMGSLVALEAALAAPDRVEHLVLVSTTGDARQTPFLHDWLRADVIEGRWRSALEARGVTWLPDAMGLTPLDADPDAVSWMQSFWNLYPFTPDRPTRELAERAARLPLATWLGATQGILDHNRLADLRSLRTPVCALWATQDSFFREGDQRALTGALSRAADTAGGTFVWKQYGRRPLAPDGMQTDDLGHNLTWDAPEQVAIDMAAYLRGGAPTGTWFRSDAPEDPRLVVGDPVQAAPMASSGAVARGRSATFSGGDVPPISRRGVLPG